MSGDDCFVIGKGMVGQATMKALDIPHFFDLKESNITLEQASKKLFCFLCLPTPTDDRGQQQGLDEIRGYIQQLKEYGGRNIFVIRSTVLPGTCKALADQFGVMVASNPEFLTEKTWEKDAVKPRIKVIGADDIPSRNALVELWKRVNSKVELITDTITAETLKYAHNVFYALKVVYANQLYDVCEMNGAKYNLIKDTLYRHPWGSRNHLNIIHQGGRGAGGKCLRKDLEAFAKYSEKELFKVAAKINKEYLDSTHKE